MSLIRFHSPAAIAPFNHLMENFFNRDFFGDDVFRSTTAYVPAVNVQETAEGYRLEVSAAGFRKEDFKLEVEGNLLKISGQHQTEESREDGRHENGRYVRREFRRASFTRSFTLPRSVDAAGISAQYQDGILHVTLPKRAEAQASPVRAIEVQ